MDNIRELFQMLFLKEQLNIHIISSQIYVKSASFSGKMGIKVCF